MIIAFGSCAFKCLSSFYRAKEKKRRDWMQVKTNPQQQQQQQQLEVVLRLIHNHTTPASNSYTYNSPA